MSGRAGLELPPTVAADGDRRHVVAARVERLEHRACGGEGDLVLARTAAGDECQSQLAPRLTFAHGVGTVVVSWTRRPTVSVTTVPAGAFVSAAGLCVITTPSSEPSVVSWYTIFHLKPESWRMLFAV